MARYALPEPVALSILFCRDFPAFIGRIRRIASTREFRPLEIGLLGTCLVFVAPVVIALGSEIKTAMDAMGNYYSYPTLYTSVLII